MYFHSCKNSIKKIFSLTIRQYYSKNIKSQFEETKQAVKEYYGETLTSNKKL